VTRHKKMPIRGEAFHAAFLLLNGLEKSSPRRNAGVWLCTFCVRNTWNPGWLCWPCACSPIASTSASERAEADEKLHDKRGETVMLTFSMQGESTVPHLA
jgi:hypothetical protein